MKLNAMKKPALPKTKQQKEKEQAILNNQAENLPNQEIKDEDIQQSILDIERIYGNQFQRDDIKKELIANNGNKSVVLEILLKNKESLDKFQEKIAALKFQTLSISDNKVNSIFEESSSIGNLFPPNNIKQTDFPLFVSQNLLLQIEKNFATPRQEI